jgi:hypothetical protein
MIDIESIKRKIAYRAQFIGLRFDSDDVFHVDISPGSTFVALARHYTYEESELDDAPVKVYHNLLWFEYSQTTHAYKNNTDFTIMGIPAPVLVMRIPFLTYWIKDNEKMELSEPGVWEEMMKEMANDFILGLVGLKTRIKSEYLNRSTS